MKRLLKSFIMLCSISLVLSLTACGNPNTETAKKPASAQTSDAANPAVDPGTNPVTDGNPSNGGSDDENESGDEGGNDTTIQILAEPFALSDTGNPFGNEEEGTADVEGHKYALTNFMTVDGYGKRRATRISSNKIMYYEHKNYDEDFDIPALDIYAIITAENLYLELYSVEYKYIKYGDDVLVSDGIVLNQTKLDEVKSEFFRGGEDSWGQGAYMFMDANTQEFIVDPNNPSNYTLNSSSLEITLDDGDYELNYTGSGKYLYYTYVRTGGKGSDSYSYYEYTRQGAETFTNTNCNYITEAVTVIRKTQLNKGYNDYTYYFDRNANPKKIFVEGTEERYGEAPEDVIYYWINGYITEKDDGNWDESNISYSKYNSDQDPASMFTDWQNGAFYYLSLTVQIKPDGTFIGTQGVNTFEGTYGSIDPLTGVIPLTCSDLAQGGITITCQASQDGKILTFYEEIPNNDPSKNLNAECCYTLIRQ